MKILSFRIIPGGMAFFYSVGISVYDLLAGKKKFWPFPTDFAKRNYHGAFRISDKKG